MPEANSKTAGKVVNNINTTVTKYAEKVHLNEIRCFQSPCNVFPLNYVGENVIGIIS